MLSRSRNLPASGSIPRQPGFRRDRDHADWGLDSPNTWSTIWLPEATYDI